MKTKNPLEIASWIATVVAAIFAIVSYYKPTPQQESGRSTVAQGSGDNNLQILGNSGNSTTFGEKVHVESDDNGVVIIKGGEKIVGLTQYCPEEWKSNCMNNIYIQRQGNKFILNKDALSNHQNAFNFRDSRGKWLHNPDSQGVTVGKNIDQVKDYFIYTGHVAIFSKPEVEKQRLAIVLRKGSLKLNPYEEATSINPIDINISDKVIILDSSREDGWFKVQHQNTGKVGYMKNGIDFWEVLN